MQAEEKKIKKMKDC